MYKRLAQTKKPDMIIVVVPMKDSNLYATSEWAISIALKVLFNSGQVVVFIFREKAQQMKH